MAVPSVKPGVTVRPPATALSSVTVNDIDSPSAAEASATVTAGPGGAASSLTIVPVAGVAVTASDVPETLRLTVKVSSGSWTASSVVSTSRVFDSPAVPAKVSAAVFSV